LGACCSGRNAACNLDAVPMTARRAT
jgi:hypothetical protein